MRRSVFYAAILLACVTTPALALDFGRWLPSIDLPALPRVEAPAPSFTPEPVAPAPAEPDASGTTPGAAVSSAPPPEPRELDPTTGVTLDDVDGEAPRARPRGWRGLLPGSLK